MGRNLYFNDLRGLLNNETSFGWGCLDSNRLQVIKNNNGTVDETRTHNVQLGNLVVFCKQRKYACRNVHPDHLRALSLLEHLAKAS